jgi:hypothetical protein
MFSVFHQKTSNKFYVIQGKTKYEVTYLDGTKFGTDFEVKYFTGNRFDTNIDNAKWLGEKEATRVYKEMKEIMPTANITIKSVGELYHTVQGCKCDGILKYFAGDRFSENPIDAVWMTNKVANDIVYKSFYEDGFVNVWSGEANALSNTK